MYQRGFCVNFLASVVCILLVIMLSEANKPKLSSEGEVVVKQIRNLIASVEKKCKVKGNSAKHKIKTGSVLSKMTCNAHCCPDGYTKHKQSCYKIFNEIMSWPEAVTLCGVNGAHLARIENKDEFDYLKAWVLANRGLLRADELWVAGMEIEAEGQWVWPETMEKIRYLPWGPGENPNDVRYNCLCMSKSYSFDYADIECDRKINFICEINLEQ